MTDSAAAPAQGRTPGRGPISRRTEDAGWFEDFTVGDRWRHHRGATVGEVENQMLTKLVMNTAQEHWNEDSMKVSPWGASRLVFGMVTGSLVVGLTSEDTAENALSELGLDQVRMRAGVFHGDTIYAFTEVCETTPAPDRDDAGIVTFHHWGAKGDLTIVFECRRVVLIKRRSHWRHR